MNLNQASNTAERIKHIPFVTEEEVLHQKDVALIFKYHRQLTHISFWCLQLMAKVGIIPTRLSKCNIHMYSAYKYAKSNKRPWRGKPSQEFIPENFIKPGELVSVDQMVSLTTDLISEITGRITAKRYKYTTVFVDKASRLGYVYLPKTQQWKRHWNTIKFSNNIHYTREW